MFCQNNAHWLDMEMLYLYEQTKDDSMIYAISG